MLQFNNNHVFTGYLKQFLSSFNLPTCRIYTAEFEKYYAEHGVEHPKVIESNLPVKISSMTTYVRAATGVSYLKDGSIQQYFWETKDWSPESKAIKYWKNNQTLHYNGNKVLGLTKTLKNPTTLYNYQTHEYLGDYLRFLRDYENINLMSMYNCFSNRLCNNAKATVSWKDSQDQITRSVSINSYDANYKIYMFPARLFEKYTIAIDCYQGVEIFCGLYDKKLITSDKAKDLIKRTYVRVPKALFNQPFIYDKLDVQHWNWQMETELTATGASIWRDTSKFVRSELAMHENNLKIFIKVPASNVSSITVLAGDYRNYNDSLYTLKQTTENGANVTWQYYKNTAVTNFETQKTYRYSTLPDINSREFKPISRLQLLALNTGISYPFADRLVEYLVMNVILPNDPTPDNIKRLQKIMGDCGYNFQIDGIWEPKMQMILYDYLMNNGKFAVEYKKNESGEFVRDEAGNKIATGRVKNTREGNLRQRGQGLQADFYDILGYGDKDAEKLYASWVVKANEKTKKKQVVAKNTLENVDIYGKLYNN